MFSPIFSTQVVDPEGYYAVGFLQLSCVHRFVRWFFGGGCNVCFLFFSRLHLISLNDRTSPPSPPPHPPPYYHRRQFSLSPSLNAVTYVRASALTHTHTHTHTCVRARACLLPRHTHTHTHTYTHTHTQTHTQTHNTQTHSHSHARTHSYTHTRAHAHTRTHARTHARTCYIHTKQILRCLRKQRESEENVCQKKQNPACKPAAVAVKVPSLNRRTRAFSEG